VRGNLFLEGPQPVDMVLSSTISQNRVAEMEVAGEGGKVTSDRDDDQAS
jgi:hypothetical protein